MLAVVPDLFFASKLAATARGAGIELELVAPPLAAARLAVAPASLVILDLHAEGAITLVAALKCAAPGVPVVGFFSHVEAALRREALAAGADAVLPRSQFVLKLPAILAHGLEALRASAATGGAAPHEAKP